MDCNACISVNSAYSSANLWIKFLSVTIRIKAIEQYFHVVLVMKLYYKVVLIFESVDEILKCDDSGESY